MICKQCGTEYPDTGKFCPGCGTANQSAPQPRPQPQTYQSAPQPQTYQPAPQPQTYQPAYVPQPAASAAEDTNKFFAAHPEYRPMSAWGYFGHGLLYSLPIIGFIFLIIHSCKSNYIARRNFARSFWCALIIAAVVFLVCALIALSMGESIFYLIAQLT